MKTKKQSDREYYLKNREKLIDKCTEWNKKNREYHKQYDRKWRLKNPNKRRESYLKRVYKISLKDYEELKIIQEGCCAICLIKSKRLVVDHCHASNKIRSLLCTTCNAGIGQFKDNVELLAQAIIYLKRHS